VGSGSEAAQGGRAEEGAGSGCLSAVGWAELECQAAASWGLTGATVEAEAVAVATSGAAGSDSSDSAAGSATLPAEAGSEEVAADSAVAAT